MRLAGDRARGPFSRPLSAHEPVSSAARTRRFRPHRSRRLLNADRGLPQDHGEGVFLEEFERRPARFSKARTSEWPGRSLDLDRPMDGILAFSGPCLGPLVELLDRSSSPATRPRPAGQNAQGDWRAADYLSATPSTTPSAKTRRDGLRQLGPTNAQRIGRLPGRILKAGASSCRSARATAPRSGRALKAGGIFWNDRRGGGAHRQGAHRLERAIDFSDLGMEASGGSSSAAAAFYLRRQGGGLYLLLLRGFLDTPGAGGRASGPTRGARSRSSPRGSSA